MWVPAVLILSMFSTAECSKYDEDAEGLISMFDSMANTPLSKDIGKLHRFKEELSEFSRKMVPFAETFAELIKTNKPFFESPIRNVTKHISNKIATVTLSLEYRFEVLHSIDYFLVQIEDVTIGPPHNFFSKICMEKHLEIERKIESYFGRTCLQTSFSPKLASILFEIIDSFKFVNYTLSKKRAILELKSERYRFGELYAALYFHLERNSEIDLSDSKLRALINEKKGVVYKNKIKLLEDLCLFFGIDIDFPPASNCLPWVFFLKGHFDRDFLLHLGDMVINDIYASKFITHMCANISNYGNPKAAEEYVNAADKELHPVYSVLTGWYDSLMESTWPVTETELIREFMKEASGGLQIEETAVEYQRIANFVHSNMNSVGHPGHFRHFLVSKEYPVAVDSPNFDYHCKQNSCSRAVSDGAQCITLRTPKDKTGVETTEFQNFVNFTERIKPTILDVLEKGYKYAPEVVTHLHNDHNVSLTTFVNHSSYIAFHKNQYFGNCRVLYGYKSEEEEKSSFLRAFSYHKDRSLFSKCHDWLFFVGF